jgi:predicted transcriptional regulator YdeE
MPMIQNIIDNQVYYGHCLYDGEYTYYTSCVETPRDEQPPQGLLKLQIPTNNYWVFKYVALHSNRTITYTEFSHIFRTVYQWLAVENQPYPEYHFEKINDRLCGESYCELDLYFPASK